MEKKRIKRLLEELGACEDSVEWVNRLPKEVTAEEAWRLCEDPGWKAWLARKLGVDMAPFVFGCADRATRVYLPAWLRRSGYKRQADLLKGLQPIVDHESACSADSVTYEVIDLGGLQPHVRDDSETLYYAISLASNYLAYEHVNKGHLAVSLMSTAAIDVAKLVSEDRGVDESNKQLAELAAMWPAVNGLAKGRISF